MRMAIRIFFSLVLFANNASARAEFYAEVQGWSVANSDDACAAVKHYDGPGETTLIAFKTVDGRFSLGISNKNWSVAPGQIYDITFILDNDIYSGGESRGYEAMGLKGFKTVFGAGFEKSFIASRALTIFLKTTLIDKLSLRGSSAAVMQVNRCLEGMRLEEAAAERERQRWSKIPVDPFKNAPKDPSFKYPFLMANTFYRYYPQGAKRENRGGTTEFSVQIDADGKLTNCRIIRSSGYLDFDNATCACLKDHGKFNPAQDGHGTNIPGEFRSHVNWAPWSD